MADTERRKDPDIDRGFAWAILAGCFLMYLFVVGGIKAYGILYTELVDFYGSGSGNTAWIGSTRFSFRTVAFIGGLLIGAGFISSGFVPSINYMYISFGLCAGLGYGLSFSPCSTIISFYFEERRALANGITVSASGIGALVFPFLYQFLIREYGLQGTFLILGAFALHVCAAACIFRQPRLIVQEKRHQQLKRNRTSDHKGLLNGESSFTQHENRIEEEKPSTCCPASFDNMFKFSLLCNPRFLMYVVAFVLCMNGYGNNLILIPAHLKALGYNRDQIALGVSIMGAFEVIARIFFGWFADKGFVKKRYMFIFNMGVAAIFCFMAPFFKSYYFFAVYAAIIGTFPGSFWSLISVLIIDVVGMKDFTAAFGLVSLFLAMGAAISQPSIGWLQDRTGNWNMSFVLTGCLLLLSAFTVMLEPCIKRSMKRRRLREAEATERAALDAVPLRIRSRSGLPEDADDRESLMEEDVELKLTSGRISRIYRPYDSNHPPPSSPDRAAAPTIGLDDV
ncbi:MOT12-like protein [Mya arenaria]|uniref:MOT12-like protein n=1 Tax=Mya arenaria TaxID=6604 RepID=A0ABY7EP61_MYAAR|nr:MOT12-like protein [Mya arenaria]